MIVGVCVVGNCVLLKGFVDEVIFAAVEGLNV